MASRIVGIALASIDILIGLIAISLQVSYINQYILKSYISLKKNIFKVSTYVLYGTNIADAASVGIWGGIFFIVTGILFFGRRFEPFSKSKSAISKF